MNPLLVIFAAMFLTPGTVYGDAMESLFPHFLRFKDKNHVELENTRDLIDLNGTFTVELWVRLRPSTQYLVGDESWPGVGEAVAKESGWALRSPDGGHFEAVIATPPKNWFAVRGKTAVPLREAKRWQHFALCKDNNATVIWWNGRLYASRVTRDRRFVPCPSNLFLGVRKNGNADRDIDADIAAFRISNVPQYHRPFTPPKNLEKTPHTLILLDIAHGKGAQVLDLSGRDHHGKLVGTSWVDE
jgi:Concanavalin A-like lectin/glucanases superfamily